MDARGILRVLVSGVAALTRCCVRCVPFSFRWNYHALPAALGCRGWFTARVTTLGELDAALARASTGESACYIEVVGGRMDFPPVLAMAHQRLDAMYAND